MKSEQPHSVAIEGKLIRADGTELELGTLAYAHRNWFRNLAGQRKVRGGGIIRALVGRGPKIQ